MDDILKEICLLRDGLQTLGHTYWGNKAEKIAEAYKKKYGQQEPITN